MKISCRKKIAVHSRKDAIIVPVYKNIKSLRLITGKKIDDELHEIIGSDYFNFEEKEIKSFYIELNHKLKKIYLVHTPKEQENPKTYMGLGAKMAKILLGDKISSVSMISFEDIYNEKKDFSSTRGFLEGLMFGLYSFDKFKTTKETEAAIEIEVITTMTKLKRHLDDNAEKLNTVFENVNIVKDMVNTPPNIMTPSEFAKTVTETAGTNMQITIWDEKDIKREGLRLLEAVGMGSANPPRFIKIAYTGDKSVNTNIALVGKGITFDTGGTSLKPAASMGGMKADMAGAATVYGVIRLIASLNLKVNINAYIPLAENIIGGKALRPSDVITSASGKTVEIMNTDAEGRLVLADALHIATKTDPETIIDLATLTGACVVALGPFCAGIFSNRKFLSKQLTDASNETGEDIWELPLFEGYEKGIDSSVADIQNMSSYGRDGGAIHAALFLKQFVDNYPWVHIDIAGPAFLEKRHPVFGKEATGFGVRLLFNFICTHYCGAKNV